MKNKMDYQLFQNYSQNKLSPQDQKKLNDLKQHDLETELFLNLFDSCHNKSNKKPLKHALSLSDDQIELLVIRLLADNIHKKDAKIFLEGVNDPLFFDKVMQVLHIASTPEPDTIDDMPEIRIQTDDEILKMLQTSSHKIRKRSFPDTVLEKVAHLQFGWKWIGVPATVIAAVALAFIIPAQLYRPNALYVKYFDDNQPAVCLLNHSPLSSLKSSRSYSDSLSYRDSLVMRYRYALSYYTANDFSKASQILSKLEKEIIALEETRENVYLQSEFNYYSGLCHLSLAGKRGQNKEHLQRSIHYLSNSLKTAVVFDFLHQDQASFFLALAYQMNGDQDQVERILSDYQIHKKYRIDAQQLKSNE